MDYITSDSLRLRRTGDDDLPFVVEAENHEDNRHFVSQWPTVRHRAVQYSKEHAHLIVETLDGARAGYVILGGLGDPNGSIELTRLVITEKNRGYGREVLRMLKQWAFRVQGAHRLWLDVREHNARAQHVYRTEGFTVEGVLRECVKTPNGYESLIVMSMLESEYY
ncbi:GNAT family N-acetyltransferase [Paenibacillus thermotolerans]|uniref:GNAT family N-acetyltransferase n=1 Tax=Paenibacillus thermotolerans TaxID=3027807 RepID=UPI002367EB72|nr:MULTISPECIES: GNAT family protein [unclassified Paenibacillus]